MALVPGSSLSSLSVWETPVGFVFMILCMNIISAVIQVFESHQVRIRLEKNLVPRMQAIKEAENA